MGIFDLFSKKTNSEISLYFINGHLEDFSPKNLKNIYDCDYIYSDGIKYDMSVVESIKSIAVPTFKFIDVLETSACDSLDYVIRMKAGQYFNSGKKELCSACLWKSTELMYANKYYAWRKEDFERLVNWHCELKMFSEADKAREYLKEKGIYENQFDSIALSIKESTFKTLKQLKMDLVSFEGYETGTCSECAKMIGRVYSVSGKDKRFPKLPEYTKKYGNFHKGCRCTMSPYFTEQDGIFFHGKKVNAIKSSSRPWIDDRTKQEIKLYEEYLETLVETERKENDRREYQMILEKLPEIAPKSFGAYRRMKNSKTKNYETLSILAKEVGIKIK